MYDSTTMGPRQQELSLNKAAIQTGDDRARPQETRLASPAETCFIAGHRQP